MKNVYFIGKAGSGKSTLASALVMNYGYKSIRFANTLYNLAYDYFKMDKKQKDRKLLQIMGTEVGRSINDNIWVNRVLEDVKIVNITASELNYPEVNFVLDDCRFKNEYEALRDNDWIGIYLDIPEDIRLSRLELRDGQVDKARLTHASETDIDKFKNQAPHIIDASKPLHEVYEEVLHILGIA